MKNNIKMNNFYLPLMSDNIDREDVNSLIDFLSQEEILNVVSNLSQATGIFMETKV